MNIKDIIYFSPKFNMFDLDLGNKDQLVEAFKDRIKGYFIEPVKILNDKNNAFAAGLILCSLIDALARYSSNCDKVGERIKTWLSGNLKSINIFPEDQRESISARIYDEFRNGLIHESHIKKCAQFSYETDRSITINRNFLILNPKELCKEIEVIFDDFVIKLINDNNLYKLFNDRIKEDFEDEIPEFQRAYDKRATPSLADSK